MNSLLDELFDLICFNLICITDLRNLSRVCKKYNLKCQKYIIKLETQYKQKYKELGLVKYFNEYCIEKFTNEIVLDGYYNLLSEKYYIDTNNVICDVLALCGNIELMKHAYSKLCPITDYTLCCAAFGGHEDIMKWIYVNTPVNTKPENICKNASSNGKINILKFLFDNNGMDNNAYDTCNTYAASYAQIDVLEWLLKIGKIDNTRICSSASSYGHLNILLWLIEKKLTIDYTIVTINATHGDHLHIIEWTQKQNNTIDVDNINGKIGGFGSIKILQWLFDNNYKINSDLICKSAIEHDNVICLQWLYDNNYKLKNNSLQKSIKYSSSNVFEWLCKHNHKLYDLILNDILNNDSAIILGWLLKNNYNVDDYFYVNSVDLYKGNIINLMFENQFDIKYIKFRKQYHFSITQNIIKRLCYGDENNCDKQKLIHINNNGNVDICNFNCGNNCWLYFLMHCRCLHENYINLATIKINECPQHKKYIQPFIKEI